MCVSLILSFMPMKTGSPISKLVLLKLADNADARGVCFPSLNYLAQYCEVSVRTVKRHVNELEKQGFVKRIKRFDDSGRQRSNIYQLRLPSGCHMEQADLNQADRGLDQTDHSDTPLGDSRSNTESDHLAHIIFHKEHKTDIPCKTDRISATENTFEKAPLFETASSLEKELATPQTNTTTPTSQQNEAVIHLLTKEGNAPIYHEFYKILERTYPKLDVLQELHAMQTWLYINPDKRKPFEHIGHFVNGWLRRSAKVKAQIKTQTKTKTEQGASPTFKQTGASKPTSASASAKSRKAEKSGATANLKQLAKPVESQQPTPVTQALADYKAKSTTNPFEARIKALVQSKSSSADSKP
ncbi:helix-turn-helix domain-containing protein [Vibrio crassostreae]|uniref:helix-turn-helix domain-containing protein n=1 Tax=Vibrio crassostreae TaxID=246167 RepID=UPI00104A77BA|nr:helix-turn-helix domain-containing protein [Vibrio crassostreae]TCN92781.1 helix-turn-helix protein [Vibrio crassostreae]CAK1929156.1 Helix-turn-helix protein [Vibrio crassostreae]CAK1937078.1 Helix-turn-helix protein [Vibrio crassostreae]CAK1942647.1 Helix-turn-helix protein [Vibrio crassostreae]CAK2714818.1 Helix-turn-helix protein [Vibrio crassostreae]